MSTFMPLPDQQPVNQSGDYSVSQPKSFAAIAAVAAPIVQTIIQQAINDHATNKQNAYNHPVQQMARLRAAGINPYSAYGAIGSQNQSAPVQPAQMRLQEAFANISAMMSLQQQKEDVRGKQLQNDILSNNLAYQNRFNENRLRSQSLTLALRELDRQYRLGELTIQQYRELSSRLQYEADSLYISRDSNDSSGIWQFLSDLGFENVPDRLSVGQLSRMSQAIGQFLDTSFSFNTFNDKQSMTSFQKDILEKNKDMLIEQLDHLKSVNDKYERWFLFNQIMSGLQTLMSVFGGGVGAARGIQMMRYNPIKLEMQ